jgi:hypothetical protein
MASAGPDRLPIALGHLTPPGPRRVDVWLCPPEALAAHAERRTLRTLLGAYLHREPAAVEIIRRCPACGGAHGPPHLDGLHVSLSYSSGLVAYAFSGSAVGVDVELIRPDFAWRPVARALLADRQWRRLDVLPDDRGRRAFFDAWVTIEAVGKAVGVGVMLEPDALIERARRASASWTVRPLHGMGRHAGALAVATEHAELRGPRWLYG